MSYCTISEIFKTDPFESFYNLDGLSKVILTTDVDWAPDYAVETLLEIVAEAGLNLTLFATHESDLLKKPYDFLEIGLHPDNTRPDKEVGFTRKISDLKSIYPDALGLRCHRNFFGQNISDLARESGMLYDNSIFLWQQPLCQAYFDYNGIVRLAYMWEDGIHADMKLDWDVKTINLDTPGLKVLNVHPLMIYLNAPSDDYSRPIRRQYSDLTKVPHAVLKEQIYQGYGIQSFYKDLLKHLKARGLESFKMIDVVKRGLAIKESRLCSKSQTQAMFSDSQ